MRSALGWTNRQQVIGYVGRLTHLKGVDLLAAAFREISRTSIDARLLIVGSGAEERYIRPALAQEISRGLVHIEADVNHDHLPEWYRTMNLLVMPSRYENFSNTVLEGMACGIPFLASDVGGNRLLAQSGAGWLCEPESVSSLRSALSQILESGSELKNHGDAGYRYVQSFQTWKASARRLEEIIVSRRGVKA